MSTKMVKKLPVRRTDGFRNRGVGRKVEGRMKTESVSLDKKPTRLPVEIIGVVAEHLIGQQAFGTTASLNLVSHAVHEETLPILYESFFPDEFARTRAGRERGARLPEGVRHSKFIFYSSTPNAPSDVSPFDRSEKLPAMVMSICADEFSPCEAGVCHIRVYRPVSYGTAFLVIGTPFYRGDSSESANAHDMCVRVTSRMQRLNVSDPLEPGEMLCTGFPISDDCLERQARPAVRSVRDIRKVILAKGACLHDSTPDRLLGTNNDLRLHRVDLGMIGDITLWEILNTVFALLKVTAMQVDVENLFEAEKELISQHRSDESEFGPSTCIMKVGYEKWHIFFPLPLPAADIFFRKLRSDVRILPQILLNRILIRLTEEGSYDGFSGFLAELHDIYSSTITDMDLVLPALSDPPEVVCCEVLGTDRKVKWSGSIKVVPREGGVLVKLELDNEKGSTGRRNGTAVDAAN